LCTRTSEAASLHEYNLLVGCPRNRERAARSEVKYFIGDLLGDPDLRISTTHVSGLLACWTGLNPFEVVKQLSELANENPYQFRYAIKFTPLERCVESEISTIVAAVQDLVDKIGESESFRVTVRRRHTELENTEIVEAAASVVPRRVNLDHPDKTVWIEVVGEWTGISILDQDIDILSIMTMRDDEY
jgi:tRNA acetyltransferase TAN1